MSLSIEEPYSIFDKQQKGVIVLIISIAATCGFIALPFGTHHSLITLYSLRLCLQHLLSRYSIHRSGLQNIDRAGQSYSDFLFGIPGPCS